MHDHLNRWLELVHSLMQRYGFDLLTRGTRLELKDDQRATEGYLIVVYLHPPVSLVLGMRDREDGEGREAFFCLVDGTSWQDPGKELITISYYGYNRYVMMRAPEEGILVTPRETPDWKVSLNWVTRVLQDL